MNFMKSTLLISSLVVAVSSAFAAPNEPAAPSTPAPVTKPPAVSASSHATVTIESGGKKETHEIDLGNAQTLNFSNTGSTEGGTLESALQTAASNILTTIGAGSWQIDPGPKPWLGVTMEPVSDELRAQLPLDEGAGLILRNVSPDGPAAKAGLQKNDVLVKLDDQLLINGNQLSALVQMKKDGEKVRLTYFRGGKSSTAEAQIRMHEGVYTGTTTINPGTLTITGGALTLNALSNLGEMVVTDKDGHVLISRTPPDFGALTAEVEKILRAAGVDDKTIAETELTIEKAAKAASSMASSGIIGNADGDAASQLKNATDQVAKSLEKARAAAEQARKQAEETRDRLEKQSDKQGDPKKTPPSQ